MNQLCEEAKTVRVMNSVAAGTSAQNSSVLDTAGFDGVRFTALFGALTATQVTSMKLQSGAASDGSDMADITGAATAALADADGTKCLQIDLALSGAKRYVRAVVSRGTANAVIDGVVADLYKGKKCPVDQHTSVKELVKVVGG